MTRPIRQRQQSRAAKLAADKFIAHAVQHGRQDVLAGLGIDVQLAAELRELIRQRDEKQEDRR